MSVDLAIVPYIISVPGNYISPTIYSYLKVQVMTFVPISHQPIKCGFYGKSTNPIFYLELCDIPPKNVVHLFLTFESIY